MKYDSWDDKFYFIFGAAIASGRVFWVGDSGDTNKELNETNVSLSSDNSVLTISNRQGE